MFSYLTEEQEFTIINALRSAIEHDHLVSSEEACARELVNCICSDTWLGYTTTDPKDVA